MSLKRRLERLEEEAGFTQDEADQEQEEKERWLARARLKRRDELSEPDADRTRSLIALFRTQNILEEMDEEELIERCLTWQPEPEKGRHRSTIEREVYLAIYRGEQGTGHMKCSEEWRKAFDAGDALLRQYEAIPDEVLASGYVELGNLSNENEEEYSRWKELYYDDYGFTEALVEVACGPDAAEVSEDENQRRLEEHTASALYGEKGYRIRRLMERLTERAPNVSE